MKRIALVTRRLVPSVMTLAQLLRQQQFDITLITGQETIRDSEDFSVMASFKNWSLSEAIKCLPYLYQLNPDILHFVFNDADEDKPDMAHFALAQAFKHWRSKLVATSLFLSPERWTNLQLRLFLQSCDLVTLSSQQHLLYALQKSGLQKQTSDVFPPLEPWDGDEFSAQGNPSLVHLAQSLNPYILVPGSPEEFQKRCGQSIAELKLTVGRSHPASASAAAVGRSHPASTSAAAVGRSHPASASAAAVAPAPLRLAFLGERKNQSFEDISYFSTLGSLHGRDLQFMLSQSEALLLAFMDLSVLELHHYYNRAILAKVPILASTNQAELLPGLIKEDVTGWTLPKGVASLRSLLAENPKLHVRPPKDLWPLEDEALNSINRLYIKALAQKQRTQKQGAAWPTP